MQRKNATRLGAAVVLIGGLLAIVMVLFPGISVVLFGEPPAHAAVKAACATSVKYYAVATSKGSNFFGQPVTQTSVVGQFGELHVRRCHDPALVVAHAKFEGLPGFAGLTGDQLTAKAAQLASHPRAWRAAIMALEAKERGLTKEDVTMSGPYQTMYMVPRGNTPPLIRVAAPDRPTFRVLRLGPFSYKLDCGFQPVAQGFAGITPLHPASVSVLRPPLPVAVSPTPVVPRVPVCRLTAPPGFVVTPQCTLVKPPQSKNCMLNGSWTQGCPPNQVDQPPQENASGTYNGPTGGAPTQRPSPLPQPTVTPTQGNPGGYDPGGNPAPGPSPSNSPVCDPSLGCGQQHSGSPPPPPS